MPIPSEDNLDEKTLKKLQKLAKKAMYSIGGGVGLLILKNILPPVEHKEHLLVIFNDIGWCIIAYGVIVLTCMIFKRKLVFTLDMLMTWFVLPAALVYVVTGTL